MKCPKCESENIEQKQVKEFNYTFKQQCLMVILPAIGFIIALFVMFKINAVAGIIIGIVTLVVWFVAMYFVKLYKETKEKKPRVRCCCKECGNIWYIDSKD